MDMRNLKRILIIGTLCIFLLFGCSPDGITDESNEKLKQTNSNVVLGTPLKSLYSISDAGIFYWNSTHLMYYDYEADQNFVLCTASNCSHSSSDCPAYIEDAYYIYGFACYEGKLYYLRQDYNSKYMEMISMDADGTNQKVIGKLDMGDYSVGSWRLDNVMPVYYSNGYAILYLNKMLETESYSKSGNQIIMLDLSDGSIQELTDILQDDIYSSAIQMVTENYMIYRVCRMEEPQINILEFYDMYGEDADYESYLTEYYETTREYITDWCVDLETGEQTEIISTVDEDVYIYWGEYKGKIITYIPDRTVEREVAMNICLLDPNTMELSQKFTFEEYINDLKWVEDSCIGGRVYDEEYLMFEYVGEDGYRLYTYSLEDGSMTEIRNQTELDEFEIWGVTENLVIGSTKDRFNIKWLTKEDYEAGKYKNATKITLNH